MRVTWLVACERILHLRGAPLSTMNIYLGEIPWNGPGIGVPIAVLMAIAPLEEEAPPEDVTMRILSAAGKSIAETTGKMPAAEPGEVGKAMIEGFLELDEPGRYTLEVLFDGTPLDDAPTWELHFVQK